MISLFVDSSHIAYQLEQDGKKDPVYSTGKVNKTYPIVFIADSYSASASEVFIGSLKDNLGAINVVNIVGFNKHETTESSYIYRLEKKNS